MPAIRVVLLAALVFFAPFGHAAPCSGFTDVHGTNQFCSNVAWLKNRGITLGCTSSTLYCPGGEGGIAVGDGRAPEPHGDCTRR